MQAVAAAALLVIGVLLGTHGAAPSAPDPQLTALRDELRDMRQLVTLSLMQQQSASERLKGVSLDQPDRAAGRRGRRGAARDADARCERQRASCDHRRARAFRRPRPRSPRRGRRASRQTSPLVQTALIDFVVAARERDSVAALRRLSRIQAWMRQCGLAPKGAFSGWRRHCEL